MKIDNKLKEIREILGVKQNAFAESIEVPLQTYIRYEHNKRDLPLSILKKILETYKIQPQTFFNNAIIGNSNIQTQGNNNIIIANNTENNANKEILEIMDLMQDYATPKLIRELKVKLLKLKEVNE